MSVKDDHINQQIQERYEEEAATCSCLSCGSTMEALNIAEGEWILDLGCGRGEDTMQAAVLVGPQGHATGLDLTSAMVAKAIENAETAGLWNTTFVQADIEALPFPDKSYDGVMSNCVINHAKDKAAVYREIRRVLKKGGRFVIADAVTKEPLPPEVKNDPQAWAECYGGAITEAEYLSAIKEAGFSRIDIINRREYIKNGYDFASLTIKAVK